MSDELPVYTVYYNPADFPGQYVVRRFVVTSGSAPQADESPLYVGDSLERARDIIPPGLYCFSGDAADEPIVVESWM